MRSCFRTKEMATRPWHACDMPGRGAGEVNGYSILEEFANFKTHCRESSSTGFCVTHSPPARSC